MKQTNYYLFDFLDFDPALQQDEYLWKSYCPRSVEARDGAVYITVPYQRQVRQNDMLADVSVPQREFTLIIKAYTHNIIRVFTSFDGSEPVDQDDMLCWHKKIRPIELSVNEDAGFYWMVGWQWRGARHAQLCRTRHRILERPAACSSAYPRLEALSRRCQERGYCRRDCQERQSFGLRSFLASAL